MPCTECGHSLDIDARFCAQCGTPVEKKPDTALHLEAERRQLAVLFCDLVDSSALAHEVGDESLRLIINGYHKTANEVINRYEGYMAQYLGDGLLIYFGYPQAHEDDSARAILAGQDILAELEKNADSYEAEYGVRLKARIGIHTGPVVISELGGVGRNETLALGETANIAARLDALAPAGSVVVSEATMNLVGGLFVSESLGKKNLKGIKEAIGVHQIIRTNRLGGRIEREQQIAPLIGRSEQLRQLTDSFERAVAGSGQAVLISGEAGYGKSRLVRALKDELNGQTHSWLECHCSDFSGNSAFMPILNLIRSGIGISELQNTREQVETLKAVLAPLELSSENHLATLLHFLSLDVDEAALPYSAERIREMTFDVLQNWVLAMSRVETVVLHCDDTHWADPSTIELLKRLISALDTQRILIVITTRPNGIEQWQDSPLISHLALTPLSAADTRKIVSNTLRRDLEKNELLDQIAQRAEGNPLYAEELAKGLASGSIELGTSAPTGTMDLQTDQHIPSTIQGALMSRLDRLGSAKELAQACSVLGRHFTREMISQISGHQATDLTAGLSQLIRADLLVEVDVGDEQQFSFKHILIQEIAYQSITNHQRSEMHTNLATLLVSDFDRGKGSPGIIARHFDAAHNYLQAITYYQFNALDMVDRFANAEAIEQLERAIELVDLLDEGEKSDEFKMKLLLLLSTARVNSAGYLDTQLPGLFRQAKALSEKVGDEDQLVHALYGLGVYHSVRGDMDEAIRLAEALKQHGQSSNKLEHKVAAHYRLAEPLFYMGDVLGARDNFELAIGHYEALSEDFPVKHYAVDLGVLARNYSAWCAWVLGYADKAIDLSEQGIAIARGRDDPHTLAHSLMFAAALHSFLRQWENSIAYGEECRDHCSFSGIEFYHALGGLFVPHGLARLKRGDMAENISGMEANLTVLAGMGHQIGGSYLMGCLAESYLGVGRFEDARGMLDLSFGLSEQTGQALWDPDLLRIKSAINQATAEPGAEREQASVTALNEALKITRAQSSRSLELRTLLALTDLQPDHAQHLKDLETVLEDFTEGDQAPDLTAARNLLPSLALES